jgi:hypothetical protein
VLRLLAPVAKVRKPSQNTQPFEALEAACLCVGVACSGSSQPALQPFQALHQQVVLEVTTPPRHCTRHPGWRQRRQNLYQSRMRPMSNSTTITCEFSFESHVYKDLQYTPHKRSPNKGRILLSDILGRRRPEGFVRESYPIGGRTL